MAEKPRVRVKAGRLAMDAFTTTPASPPLYDAAGSGPRTTGWWPSQAGPNAALAGGLDTLVTRSRDAVRRNGWAESVVEGWESNLVGTGIKPQWQTRDPEFNRFLAELWREWTDESDADGLYDFYGQQALAVRAWAEGGEVFARFRARRAEDVATVPLQVQLVEPELVPLTDWPAPTGRQVRLGVEMDALGRRTAYWMLRRHPGDPAGMLDLADDAVARPVPASEVAHIYLPRRPGSLRGEPVLTRALVKLRDIDETDDATVMRQKLANLFTAFITADPDARPIASQGAPNAQGVAEAHFIPSLLNRLRPGEKIEFSDPPEVGVTYDTFMRQQLRAIAAGGGMLYELLTGDYGQVNDRTFRASVNEFRRRVRMRQWQMMVFRFCRPTVQRWLDLGLASGAILLPASVPLSELYRVDWMPQGWEYIHPVQDEQARQMRVRSGFSSRKREVSGQGDDVEQIDAENASDALRTDRLGLAYDSDGRRPRSGGKTPEDGGDREERPDA